MDRNFREVFNHESWDKSQDFPSEMNYSSTGWVFVFFSLHLRDIWFVMLCEFESSQGEMSGRREKRKSPLI